MDERKKVLLTGGTGFIGRNILPLLQNKYNVIAPSRMELDLRDSKAVEEYVKSECFAAIIHCANPNPVKNQKCDIQENMFSDSMRIFMNFYNVRSYCGKMLYFGSGAEFDKSRDIIKIKEEQVGESIPKDIYGFAKFCMNELAKNSENVYNLRIFGCYGPYDHESKFLTHVIRCCMENKDITIRQNCYFDYMQVFDLAEIVEYVIEHEMKYRDYNVCTGDKISLVTIAEKIKQFMGNNNRIVVLNEGLNNEYTADNSRLLEELGKNYLFTKIDDGIAIQVNFETGGNYEKKSSRYNHGNIG